jgi:transcriptional regulator with XRE-family HTH domain
LIAYRVQHGLTQSGLARRLGLSLATVAELEDAEELPMRETLAKVDAMLADGLEVD